MWSCFYLLHKKIDCLFPANFPEHGETSETMPSLIMIRKNSRIHYKEVIIQPLQKYHLSSLWKKVTAKAIPGNIYAPGLL